MGDGLPPPGGRPNLRGLARVGRRLPDRLVGSKGKGRPRRISPPGGSSRAVRPGAGWDNARAVIQRYTRPEMARVWSEEEKLRRWTRIEILAAEAWAEMGVIPKEDLALLQSLEPPTPEEVVRREELTRHDVAAFVDVLAEKAGPAGRWLHHGLTSYDVVDTALSLALRDSAEILIRDVEGLLLAVKERALEHRYTVMAGRTHGILAEPTTFGAKLAVWAFELARARDRLARAREAISVGKLSGAVGSYARVPPQVEEYVCRALGLRPAEASTQVLQRDRHAEFMAACAITASSLERFATEVRHLQRSEVGEVEEPFAPGQKGSSAMPHKRNPVLSERVAGLARVIRGNLVAALENIPLWHERDISHSSAERVILADTCLALDYILDLFTGVVRGLRVFPERMRENLERAGGVIYSEGVLLALVERGLSREKAYRVVQRAAMAALEKGASFREELLHDPEVGTLLEGEIEELLRPEPYLENLEVIFERLEALR